MPEFIAQPVKVFIIYARENELFKNRLVTVLTQSQRRGEITLFHDKLIQFGENWNNRISAELQSARIAIPMLSIDYYASEFIHDTEARKARQRYERGELIILPVLVEPCESSLRDDDFLTKIQYLPSSGPIERLDNARAFDEVAGAIIEKAKEIRRLEKEAHDREATEAEQAEQASLFQKNKEKEAETTRERLAREADEQAARELRDQIEALPVEPSFFEKQGKWLAIGAVCIVLAVFGLKNLGKKEGGLSDPPKDDGAQTAWQQTNLSKIPSIERYLTNFPKAAHSAEARTKLEELQKNFDVNVVSGKAMIKGGEFEEARTYLRRAADIDPTNQEVQILLKKY